MHRIGFVFLIHELGHLLAAKACGMKISRYYLGFDAATDPRSFAAKAVWQRIVVIAAGSLMNLVFAAAVAAVAYRLGVSYTPCILGGTAAGDPAWELGLRPGDKILQIGRSGQPNEHLRFDKDLMTAVLLHGTATELEMLVRRYGQPQPEWVSIQPSDRLQSIGRPATLGVHSANTTRLAESWPRPGDQWAEPECQLLLPGDEIVAVNQTLLPRDERTGEILGHHLEAIFAQNMTQPLTLTVLRPAQSAGDAGPGPAQRIEVVVPPVPLRVLGLAMQAGPVMAVRVGSAAEDAGFRVGDVLLTLEGQDVGDPLTLAQRLLPLVGRQIEVAVRREDGLQPVILRVTPQPPTAYGHSLSPGGLLALESLGVALRVENVVQSVDPDGPASQAGLRADDEITEVRFLPTDPVRGEEATSRYETWSEEPIELSPESPNWAFIDTCLQALSAPAELEVTYRRQDTTGIALITPVESDVWFRADRGLRFEPLQQRYVADSWTDACVAGIGETQVWLRRIMAVLRRLVSGKIGVQSLGGPVMLIGAGSNEASEGMPRLLIFLAFVSVNFAVLCWLPIPGLDGGHLLFLAVEGLRGKPVSGKLQLIMILIVFVCPMLALRSLPVSCLSQLFRLIGLIRPKRVNS